MIVDEFQGNIVGYSYDKQTGNFLLYEKIDDKFPLSLTNENADLFRTHLEAIYSEHSLFMDVRIENLIQGFFFFLKNPSETA
jgi:hypothetical protein